MKKSCMNCARRCTVLNCATGVPSYRCGLDMDMRVNRRMCCEAWTDHIPVPQYAIGTAGMTTFKKRM